MRNPTMAIMKIIVRKAKKINPDAKSINLFKVLERKIGCVFFLVRYSIFEKKQNIQNYLIAFM